MPILLHEYMQLWGKTEQLHMQNMEQLHGYDLRNVQIMVLSYYSRQGSHWQGYCNLAGTKISNVYGRRGFWSSPHLPATIWVFIGIAMLGYLLTMLTTWQMKFLMPATLLHCT